MTTREVTIPRNSFFPTLLTDTRPHHHFGRRGSTASPSSPLGSTSSRASSSLAGGPGGSGAGGAGGRGGAGTPSPAGASVPVHHILAALRGGVDARCEVVAFIPTLLCASVVDEVTTSSLLLRLVECFSTTVSNTVRGAVVRALQRVPHLLTERALANVPLFLHHISCVLDCNDPVSRASALRALALLPHLIANRREIHHKIFHCLQSQDAHETRAAVAALRQVCSVSPQFTKSILPLIATSLQRLDSRLDKPALACILSHAHYDVECIDTALNVGFELLEAHLIEARYAEACLPSLTALVVTSGLRVRRVADKTLALFDSLPGAGRVCALQCLRRLVHSAKERLDVGTFASIAAALPRLATDTASAPAVLQASLSLLSAVCSCATELAPSVQLDLTPAVEAMLALASTAPDLVYEVVPRALPFCRAMGQGESLERRVLAGVQGAIQQQLAAGAALPCRALVRVCVQLPTSAVAIVQSLCSALRSAATESQAADVARCLARCMAVLPRTDAALPGAVFQAATACPMVARSVSVLVPAVSAMMLSLLGTRSDQMAHELKVARWLDSEVANLPLHDTCMVLIECCSNGYYMLASKLLRRFEAHTFANPSVKNWVDAIRALVRAELVFVGGGSQDKPTLLELQGRLREAIERLGESAQHFALASSLALNCDAAVQFVHLRLDELQSLFELTGVAVEFQLNKSASPARAEAVASSFALLARAQQQAGLPTHARLSDTVADLVAAAFGSRLFAAVPSSHVSGVSACETNTPLASLVRTLRQVSAERASVASLASLARSVVRVPLRVGRSLIQPSSKPGKRKASELGSGESPSKRMR